MPITRYRVTTSREGEPEQTWVLLPDQASAIMQAEEHHTREKTLHVRVFREETGNERVLLLDLAPK